MYSEEWKKDVDENLFWLMIELALTDEAAFIKRIEAFDRKALIWFYWHYESLESELGQEKFLKFTNPSYSEDSRDDLWREVVGKGKQFYSSVMKNPELLPTETDYSHPAHKIKPKVSDVFYKRYNEEIPPNSYDY